MHMARPANTYPAEKITQGLIALIAHGGAVRPATDALKAEGFNIAPATLTKLREANQARYRELEREYGGELEAIAVDAARRSLTLAAAVEQGALEQILQEMAEKRLRDPSQTALNASKIKNTNVDQVLKLTGRPTVITEHKNADELLDGLMAKLGSIEGTATEDEPQAIEAGTDA